ncbi:hypothetical protein C4D60_Mb00t06050 [Musa balbisiana]|uniref:Uncharacterized protein n=2 Tax=Musa TaxID=4640 RepID=A0A4S8I4S0_MUSBA|nr:hypothetical protein C4D60_Mb00t13850 [Musa balbisiana]THU42211.1 hypothetical protein C4D60_Mb00t11700 [Musa balbisiana]THU42270.1 hypothetical protein C4D60_Mb00t15960 [Musa balbisiana]THU42840.1 hypothetical protein C4D60_Mb00t14470 [Musa balbisiana]THU43743.1 hypothetical protein C4D60_Mb00t06050 [Musa balbisiana]
MRQKIFFLKRFDSELLYVQGPILKSFQRFSLTLSVSTNNSKYLDFFRTDTYRILWKAVFDESRMYGLEGDLSYLSRSTLQYGVKKPK